MKSFSQCRADMNYWIKTFAAEEHLNWDSDACHALAIFLCLKVRIGDSQAMILSPSSKVDALWRRLILSTASYRAFIHKFCPLGQVIDRRPLGANDELGAVRYTATRHILKHIYPAENMETFEEWWPELSYESTTPNKRARTDTTDRFRLEIEMPDGVMMYMFVNYDTLVSNIQQRIHAEGGPHPDEQFLRITENPRTLQPSRSLSENGVTPDSTVRVFARLHKQRV